MNANLDSAGCLQVPPSGAVTLGACNAVGAGQWSVTIGATDEEAIQDPLPPASSGPPIGAIVGGVLGGIIAVAAAVGIRYFVSQKKKDASKDMTIGIAEIGDEKIQPDRLPVSESLEKTTIAPSNVYQTGSTLS